MFISILALGAAGLSALYSRWSAAQAKRANDVGRLNALLAMRVHYLELIERQFKIADLLPERSVGMENVRVAVAELDEKLKEVNQQVDAYHTRLVENKI